MSASAIWGRRAAVDELERRMAVMKLKVQLIIESDSGETEVVQEVAKLETALSAARESWADVVGS